MAFTLPNPTVPTNGQSLDATPVLQNILAIAQAIQSFDGSQIQAGTIPATAMNSNVNPNTLLNETTFPFVQTGVIWSVVSGLNGTMSGGRIYINGIRVTVNSVASNTFTASKDTYIDVDVNGNVTYQAVTTGAAAPALTANSIRVAKVITSGAAITSIFTTGIDSLGNMIYPLVAGTKSAADANGWVKKSYGKFNTYEQTVAVNNTIGPGAGFNQLLNLPVGIADTSNLRIYSAGFHGFVGRIFFTIDSNQLTPNTILSTYFWNNTGGGISVIGYGSVMLTTT